MPARHREPGSAIAILAGDGEDRAEEARQLAPLGVRAAVSHGQGERLQALQRLDLDLQLGDGPRRGRLIEDLLLGGLDLVVRRLFEVLDVLGVERGKAGARTGATWPAALEHLQLAQPALQPLAATAQRLVDRLGRGGEPALEDGEREADGAGPLVVLQRLGAVELLAHVFGDRLVEVGLGIRELVGDGVGDPLREERRAVELEQVLLDHAAHQVGDVGRRGRRRGSGPRSGRRRAAP